MSSLEFSEDLSAGMAEAVAASAREDGPGGLDCGEKGWARRGEAAMMADFEDGAFDGQAGMGGLGLVRLSMADFRENGLLLRRFGVAGQQDGACLVDGLKDERIVVGGLHTGVVTGGRSEDADLKLAEGELVAVAEVAELDACGLGGF